MTSVSPLTSTPTVPTLPSPPAATARPAATPVNAASAAASEPARPANTAAASPETTVPTPDVIPLDAHYSRTDSGKMLITLYDARTGEPVRRIPAPANIQEAMEFTRSQVRTNPSHWA